MVSFSLESFWSGRWLALGSLWVGKWLAVLSLPCGWALLWRVSVQCNIIQIGGYLHQLVSRWAVERRMPRLREGLAFHPEDMYGGWRNIMSMMQIPLCMLVTAGLSYSHFRGLDIHVQYLTPGFRGFFFSKLRLYFLQA